jgi:geranylgeranyl pyrophosphate synthase
MNFKLKQKNNAYHSVVSRVSFGLFAIQYETKEPRNLYEPIHYILDLGKKMRPVLTLMSAEVLMPIIKKALPALAVEVFIIFH